MFGKPVSSVEDSGLSDPFVNKPKGTGYPRSKLTTYAALAGLIPSRQDAGFGVWTVELIGQWLGNAKSTESWQAKRALSNLPQAPQRLDDALDLFGAFGVLAAEAG